MTYGVPLQSLWLGLILNFAIFGLAWLMILLAVPAVRRHLRRRRHHCPSCNYNLSGLPPESPCPECGNAASTP